MTAFALSRCPRSTLPTPTVTSARSASPEIDAKVDQALYELDPDKARALANEVDKLIWQEVFSLPLFQSPGNVAVRSDLANYGPAGLADADWTAVGFI